MEIQMWLILVIVIVAIALGGLAVWRFSAVAGKGIDAVAGMFGATSEAIKPLTHATGHVIEGVGNIVHGAGAIVDVFADTLRNKQRERVQLAAENASLHAEIEQLKSRRVSATAVERQLQVAFFSIQSKYTSFRNTTTSADAGGMLGMERPTSSQYLGLIEADFTVKVGVDIRKLTFSLKGAATVYVHGAHHVQHIGLSDINLKPLLSERRQILHATRARDGGIEVLTGETEAEAVVHMNHVLSEIQNSSMASALAEVNERVAIGFFQAMMGAGRYEFIATSEPIEHPLTFEQLCREINDLLARQIEELQAKQAHATKLASVLDDEIVKVAVAGHNQHA